ncbi:MAG TPA: MFS transporter, partial [Acidimicrobiia bacterium]
MPTGFITNRPLALSLILGAAMAISTVAGTLVGVLGPFLRSEIGITPAGLGLLVTVFAATSGALSWPAGQLTDSIGGRRALIIVFVVSAVALLAFSMAFSYGWLVVAMVMAGIGNAAANPATNRLVATT